jgi:hypothetical protein
MDQSETASPAPPLKHAVFVLLLTGLVYAQSLTFPFLRYDDTTFIVHNPQVQKWSFVPYFFSGVKRGDVLGTVTKLPPFYRPLQATWMVLNYKLFGLHPALWRLAAMVLYGLGVWLLWRIAWKLTQDAFIALATALLYALHPMHTEGIAWLSGACVEPLVSALFFAGFLAYLRWREDGRTIWLITCALLTLADLLCKETAAALPVLIIAHAWLFRSRMEPAHRWRRLLALVLGLVAAIVIYSRLRVWATGSLVVSQPAQSWADILRTVPSMFVMYLKHALWPVHLGNWYDTPMITAATDARFYLPLAVVVAFVALTVWALVRKPLAGFLLLWWIVALGPSFVGLRSLIPWERLHDRYAFIALVGLCMIVAGVLRTLPDLKFNLFGFKATSALALAALTVSLGVFTALQVNGWRNDMAMYVQAVRGCPTCPRPRLLLAGWYANHLGDLHTALELDRQAIQMSPDRWEPLYAYGLTLAASGDKRGGMNELIHAIHLAPGEVEPYLALAEMLASAGNTDAAIQVLQRGIPVVDRPQILQDQVLQIQAWQKQNGLAH